MPLAQVCSEAGSADCDQWILPNGVARATKPITYGRPDYDYDGLLSISLFIRIQFAHAAGASVSDNFAAAAALYLMCSFVSWLPVVMLHF